VTVNVLVGVLWSTVAALWSRTWVGETYDSMKSVSPWITKTSPIPTAPTAVWAGRGEVNVTVREPRGTDA
jgi:hypothetical protein